MSAVAELLIEDYEEDRLSLISMALNSIPKKCISAGITILDLTDNAIMYLVIYLLRI